MSCQKKQTEIELLNKKDPIGLYGENIIAKAFFQKLTFQKTSSSLESAFSEIERCVYIHPK